MRRGISRACALFAVAVFCVITSRSPVAAQQPQPTREGIITTFAPVVEKVAPSVVTVFTTQTVSRGQAALSFSDDALRQFFGGRAPQREGKQTLQGLGSGVIVSSDGYILTANHVVSGADEILIGLGNDLRRFKAKKIGADPGTDVALLKIEENNLPSVSFADSDKARAGDIVLAIGNPFGLRQTVTMGIISAEIAEAMKLKGQPTGALVGEVEPNAPAAKAGIKTRDVITAVNGKKVNDPRELRLMIGSMTPGTKAHIDINREGQTKTFDLQLGEMPPTAAAEGAETSSEETAQPEKTTVFGGVGVTNITDDIRTALNLPKEVQGAVISDIDTDSPSAKSGLREGDVIQEVNKQPVKSAKDLLAISKKLKPNEKILIRVYSQGRSGYVALDGG